MIVYYLFVHKKSVRKRKVCIIFIKNQKVKKKKKTQKTPFLVGFFRWFLFVFFGWVFLGGFFNANPASNGPSDGFSHIKIIKSKRHIKNRYVGNFMYMSFQQIKIYFYVRVL